MSFAEDVLAIVLRQIPWISLAGKFRMRVVGHNAGRLDLEPVSPVVRRMIDPMRLRDVWCGIPGCRVEPQIGAAVIVEFLDRDESQAVVTGFCPLAQSKPVRIEIDASGHVDLGPAGGAVVRTIDKGSAGEMSTLGAALIVTNGQGDAWGITWAVSGAVATPSITPLGGVGANVSLVTVNPNGSPRVRA